MPSAESETGGRRGLPAPGNVQSNFGTLGQGAHILLKSKRGQVFMVQNEELQERF